MPLLIPVIWSWISSGWVAFVMPILKWIPWQVWAAIAAIIAVLYYGHVREARGYDKCHVEVVKATNAEVARQAEETRKALDASKLRESDALAKANQTQEDLNNALSDVAKLKTAKTVCLPGSITDQFNGVRKSRK